MRTSYLLPVLFLVAACGAGSSDGGARGGPPGQPDAGADASALIDGGETFDASGGDEPPPGIATLHGTVRAPEGTIPISGALVYLTPSAPPAIPSGLYCDQCVKLGASTPWTLSRADGSFDLPAYQEGAWQLVVQKGQFRRVRPFTITQGDLPVPAEATTLPHANDPGNGDTIPKMAIVNMAWDHIDVSLARLGLGTLVPGPFGLGLDVDRATAPYDYWDGAGLPGSKGSYLDILANPALLAQYNIVFLPCSWSGQGGDATSCNTSQPSGDANVQSALQQYVAAGGKLYVTDYSYEFVRQPFPGYVTWRNESPALGSACLQGAWDAPASSPDPGLTAWLGAQGITSFDVEQSWTAIDAVHPIATTDVDGNPVTVTPKVWVEANGGSGTKPTTISFEQKCGRVLYSTYHTEGSASSLLPQERALLYVLLEVGVCVAPPEVH